MADKRKIILPVLDEHMLRKCYIYGEEYNECMTPKGRFHQYFIFGEFLDCSQWQKDYENCLLWKNHGNKIAYEELIKSENKRRNERIKGHYENDIWTKRDNPPENWNMPLPDWMIEKNKNQKSNIDCTTVSDFKACSIL